MTGNTVSGAEKQASDRQEGPKNGRRCLITKETEPAEGLVRLVVGPEGLLVPDVAAKLPGRGVWIVPDAARIKEAAASGLLYGQACRSFKMQLPKAAVPENLAEDIDRLLSRRVLDRLGLEQRAGHLVTGFDKIKAALAKAGQGVPELLLEATDGAEDGRRKIQAIVGREVPVIAIFDRDMLSKALGRDNVVHVLLMKSGGTLRLKADISRLLRLRGIYPLPEQGNAE